MSAVIAQAAIVAKVVQLLGASATLTGVPIQRNRLRAVADGVSRVIVVRKSNSDAAGVPLLGHGTDWITQVRVECYARGTAAQESHEAADALLLLAHGVMAANPTLDGLAMGVDPPRIGWDEEDLDAPLGVAIAQYPVLHRTASNSLIAAA
jgi:hypothetical protein